MDCNYCNLTLDLELRILEDGLVVRACKRCGTIPDTHSVNDIVGEALQN